MNPNTLISEDAEKIAVKLLDKASKEGPDTGGKLISLGVISELTTMTDLYCYQLLDLIDKTLSTLHTKITKKQWDEAWSHLEALTVFMDLESSWPSKFLSILRA